ncbi:fimbrillin family protein, partial [Bacteroides uniformis]
MKKRNNYPYHHTAALLMLPVVLMVLVGACTADDGFVPWPGEAPATSAPPLTITVTDGAYAPAPTANDEDDATAPATRAVERGFATEFTEGDQIGLYEVIEKEHGDGESLYDVITKNLCLTYDGTAWTLPTGAKLTPERPTDGRRTHYYAYYPWQKDEDMVDKVVGDDGKVFTNPSGTPFTPQEFFARLISDWYPALDQSTYAAYTASDLMVSLGTVTQRTDGTDGSELRFEMEHQMALAVVRVPSTEYTYSETISGSNTEKSYRLYTGMNTGVCWQENSHTARLLVNPQYGTTLLMGYYYTAELKKC